MRNSQLTRFTLLLLFFSFQTVAQTTLKGKLVDDITGESLPFANVVLTSVNFQKINTSDLNGEFTFKGLETGKYEIAITYIGYEEFTLKNINIVNNGSVKDLGILALIPSTEVLDEVLIEESAKAYTTTIDGIEINPENNVAQQGGSVLDVLQNAPSISIDQDGNISLRGTSSTNILINGRNSSLIGNLDAIPASAVDNITINNNPGAKYDAQGQGGIINITLKDGTDTNKLGLSGNAGLSIGNFGRYNGSLNLSQNWKKIKVNASYNKRNDYVGNEGETNRTTISTGEEIRQNSSRTGYRNSDNITAGISYFLNSKNTIDVSSNLIFRNDDTEEEVFNREYDSNGVIFRNTLRSSDKVEQGSSFENSIAWTKKYTRGSKLISSFSHSSSKNESNYQYIAYDYSLADLNQVLSRQRSNNDDQNQIVVGQIDYSHQLNESTVLETGAKGIYRSIDTEFLLEDQDQSTQEYTINTDASNYFQYEEQVYAAYLSFKTKSKDIEYYTGVRSEQTIINSQLVRTNQNNSQNYISFFPSAKIAYNLDEKQTLKFTYSRRIDRPDSRRLNPFVDISDSLNIYQGDPNLLPEFINSFELGHQIDYKKAGFTTTLFYRRVKNQMDWVSRFQVEENFVYRGPANLDYADNLGLEFITQANLTKWWDVNASITFFYASIVGDIDGINYNNSNFTSNAQINTNFKLPWNVNAQLTFDYEGPEAEAQGNENSRYNIDVGLKKPILENGYVSFNARDIFNTLNRTENSSGPGFTQYRKRDWQSQIFQLGLGYKF